ncbi:MAG TPA: hypothetical protein VM184_04600 [Gaiellaceae bacterium]|nr:hypothetical protein [Gaiellaceae bacterium]
MVARIRDDRLLRWSAYAAAPFVWLALALFNPFLLLVPPLITLALRQAMTYGILERYEPEDEPDFF